MLAAERTRIGANGPVLTRLGIGTGPLGGLYEPVSDGTARACLKRALDLGIGYLDTAPLYGYGIAEQRVGDAVANRDRAAIAISTKVGRLLGPPRPGAPRHDRYRGAPPLQPTFDFSRDGIVRSVEESLTRVGVDRFDMLLLHDPDDHLEQAVATALPTLQELREEGLAGAIGVGTNDSETAMRLVVAGDLDCVLIANRYTLLDHAALDGLLPACQERGVAVVAAGVFNSGLLADPHGLPMFDYEPAPSLLVERALALESVCERHGVPLRAAALQFPLSHPAVTCVLPGCRSAAEVEENVRCFEAPVPAALWSELRGLDLLPADVPIPGERERVLR